MYLYYLDANNNVRKVVKDVREINENQGFIKYGNSGKLSGIAFSLLNFIVTDEVFEVGDTIPSDTVNKKDTLIVKSEREMIEELQKENAELMLQLVTKGVL